MLLRSVRRARRACREHAAWHIADDLHLTPLELIDRIAALVSPSRTRRPRYFGVLSPNSQLRAAVPAMACAPTPRPTTQPQSSAQPAATGESAAETRGPVRSAHAIAPALWAENELFGGDDLVKDGLVLMAPSRC
jgi:Putative transposase